VRRDERAVLVVDDYNTMRRIMRNLLAQIGFANVDEAEDGAIALEKMRQRAFDLVISDWTMTSMSGLDLLRQMRLDPALKAVPFIMVTAVNGVDNVVAAKAAGVSNYIVKPFTAETLRRKIETVLGAA
jgi:two-component system, chemotaxis family, chemotaxis protein CheY